MEVIFAPFGNSSEFYEKYSSSFDAPKYINSLSLNGYEYLCNEGVHISDDGCAILKENAEKYNIALSVRAYDFLNLSSEDEKIRKKGVKILCDTVKKASLMGAKRVVFPLDNCAIRSRKSVYEHTLKSIDEVFLNLKENNTDDVFLCPETMGLIHDLGEVNEVISICKNNDMLLPCFNAGNIYARSLGKDYSFEYYKNLIEKTEKKLGSYRSKNLHFYYSKVEYTHHGYKKDLNFCDCDDENQSFFGLLKAVKYKGITPFIVCKSPDFSDKDCMMMKNHYNDEVLV